MPPYMQPLTFSGADVPTTGLYLPVFILFSFVVATLSAYTALKLGWNAGAGDRVHKRWLLGAGFALGSGVWSAEFISMLGADPGHLSYDVSVVCGAMALALLGSVAAQFIIGWRGNKHVRWLLASAVLSGAIVAMHYLGCFSMSAWAVLTYDTYLVALSVLIGLGLCSTAVWCVIYRAEYRGRTGFVASLLFGAAVAGLQYTGMVAITVTPVPELGGLARISFPPELLPLIVGAGTLTTFGLALLALSAERQASDRVATILTEMTDSFYALDRDWRLTYLNPRAEQYMGFAREQVLHRQIWDLLPASVTDQLRPPLEQAAADQTTHRIELQYRAAWYEMNVYPSQHGMSVYFREITEKKTAEQALTQAAEERDHARNRFLRIAAHELRNPMAGVKGLLSLMQWMAEQGEPVTQVLKSAHLMEREIDRISGLLDEIIEAFRAGEGKLKLKLETVDMAALVTRVLEPYHVSPGKHGFIVDLPGQGVAQVQGDPCRLEDVLRTLLSNAVKYSPAGGDIHVRLAAEGGQAVLTVRDSGIGVPEDEQDRLFEPFFRASNLKDRDPGGLGLGLYVAQEIVRRHGGEVQIESSNNKGATLTVALPLSRTFLPL